MNRPFALLTATVLVIGCTVVPAPTATPSPAASPAASPSAAPTQAPDSPTTAASPGASVAPPTATPGVAPGLVVDKEMIREHLDAFQAIADANDGIRAAGLPGYDASADYVVEVMEGLGFQVERHSFEFAFFNEAEPVSVGLGDIGWSSPEWLHAALYSGSADIEAPTELVFGGCEPGDWSAFTAGSIAMVEGGGCFLRQKVDNAQNAGAVALISFYPWAANEIHRPTLLDPEGINIPVVVAGSAPSDALRDQAGQIVDLYVHAENRIATVDNIIATLPGATDSIVMLGGHLDSVLDGPGINDNGSGVATLLSLAASVVTQPQAGSTIQFGFWAAEEFGDLGSFAYVGELSPAEIGQISAYLNLDMVGSPNPGRYVYDDSFSALGSAALTERLLVAFDELGAPAGTIDSGGASDHFPFAQAGVPTGGVFSGLALMTPQDAALFGGVANEPEDPCYHLACDTIDNINLDSAALLGQAVANVLVDLAY